MNKQNFTSKFSNLLEEEKQNQSRKMNGGEINISEQKESDGSRKCTAENEKLSFPLKPHEREDTFCSKPKQHQQQQKQNKSPSLHRNFLHFDSRFQIFDYIRVLLWHSRFRIWCCYCSSSGHCSGMGSIPGPGNFHVPQVQPKKNFFLFVCKPLKFSTVLFFQEGYSIFST